VAIPLDENILLTVAGLVFVPVFVFFVKLIIEVGNIKNKLDSIGEQIKETELSIEKIREHESDIRILKLRVDNLEKEKEKGRRVNRGGIFSSNDD
jgi:hypothetical protein